MLRFEIRPLGPWGKPLTRETQVARFRVDWARTVDDLTYEVDALGAALVVVQADVDDTQIRRDGMLKSSARVGFQGVKVSFESNHGPLTYATDTYTYWKDNVRAVSLTLTALRAVDRYGATASGEQYRGFTALADKPFGHGSMTVDDAISVLLTTTGADVTRDELAGGDAKFVTAAYRSAAKLHHPDSAFGNESVFKQITKARDVLLARP